MATISNITVGRSSTSAKLDGVQFNNISNADGQGLRTKWNRSDGPWKNSSATSITNFAMNAVDIDWNSAQWPSVTPSNTPTIINSTGDLINAIKWASAQGGGTTLSNGTKGLSSTGNVGTGNIMTGLEISGGKITQVYTATADQIKSWLNVEPGVIPGGPIYTDINYKKLWSWGNLISSEYSWANKEYATSHTLSRTVNVTNSSVKLWFENVSFSVPVGISVSEYPGMSKDDTGFYIKLIVTIPDTIMVDGVSRQLSFYTDENDLSDPERLLWSSEEYPMNNGLVATYDGIETKGEYVNQRKFKIWLPYYVQPNPDATPDSTEIVPTVVTREYTITQNNLLPSPWRYFTINDAETTNPTEPGGSEVVVTNDKDIIRGLFKQYHAAIENHTGATRVSTFFKYKNLFDVTSTYPDSSGSITTIERDYISYMTAYMYVDNLNKMYVHYDICITEDIGHNLFKAYRDETLIQKYGDITLKFDGRSYDPIPGVIKVENNVRHNYSGDSSTLYNVLRLTYEINVSDPEPESSTIPDSSATPDA